MCCLRATPGIGEGGAVGNQGRGKGGMMQEHAQEGAEG